MNTTPSPVTTPTTPAQPTTTGTHMNEEQAELLTTLIHSMRPDWGKQGILKHLQQLHATMDVHTLTLGAMHAAADPNNRTPGILMHPGKHWNLARGIAAPAKPTEPQRSQGIDTSPMCANHPDLHEWECKTCNQPAPPPPNFKQMVKEATEAARRAMNASLDAVDEAAGE